MKILKEDILDSRQMYPYTKNQMSMMKNEANMQMTNLLRIYRKKLKKIGKNLKWPQNG